MVAVNVRSLSGKRAEVECDAQQTVRQLKRELEVVDAAFATCKLYLRGKSVGDGRTVGSLLLQPGEFLVAIETKKPAKHGQHVSSSLTLGSRAQSASLPTQPQQSEQQQQPSMQATNPSGLLAAASVQAQHGEELGGPLASQQAPSASGGGFLPHLAVLPASTSPAVQQQGTAGTACPGSPRSPPASHAGLPASPGQLDSLLPGYLCRPNPSPMKARRTPPLPQHMPEAFVLDGLGGAGRPGGQVAEQGSEPPKYGTLLQLAAARFGLPPVAAVPAALAAAAAGMAAGQVLSLAPRTNDLHPAAAVAETEEALVGILNGSFKDQQLPARDGGNEVSGGGRSLWEDLHQELLSAQQVQQAGTAGAAQRAQQASLQQPGVNETSGETGEPGGGNEGALVSRGNKQGGGHMAPTELAAAFWAGDDAEQPARRDPSSHVGGPSSFKHGLASEQHRAAQAHEEGEVGPAVGLEDPSRRPAKRQRRSSLAAGCVPQPQQEEEVKKEEQGVEQHPTQQQQQQQQQQQPQRRQPQRQARHVSGRQRALHSKGKSSLSGAKHQRREPSPEGLETVAAAAAVAAADGAAPLDAALHLSADGELSPATLAELPLPPAALELERCFGVVAAVYAFLAQQHIQASWRNVREAVHGAGMGAGALSLPQVQLMAALCPWVMSVKEHHRLHGLPYREPWKAGARGVEVEEAVAVAAAAERAGEGHIPHPMQVRTDGAGTVLEGDNDTHVIEVVDPGRGFTKMHPIPPAFLAHLATAGLSSLPAPMRATAMTNGGADQPRASCGTPGEGCGPPKEVTGPQEGPSIAQQAREVPGAESVAATSAEAQAAGDGGELGMVPRRQQPRENARVRQAWAFRLGLLRALRWLEREQSTAQQAELDRIGGDCTAVVDESAALDHSASVRLAPTSTRAPCGRATSLPTADSAADTPTARAAQPAQHASWSLGFAAALPSITHGDLHRAALALKAEEEAAAAKAAAPVDALEAARAAAAAVAAAHSEDEGECPLAEPSGAGKRPPAAGRTVVGKADGGRSARARKESGPVEEKRGGRAAGVARPPSIMKHHEPCRDTTEMGTEAFLEHLQSLPWYCRQVVHCQRMAARRAVHAEPAARLAPAVLGALRARGVGQLFSHQAQAVDLLLKGRHTVVATSTASGKSVCYNVPILQALAEDPGACALYMFPTKALAQDQLRVLRELTHQAFGDRAPHVEIYDGDTPKADRPGVRDRAQLLITNPDMLHMSILPVHGQFGRLMAGLKYVVVDEGHTYKGVFGCHTALVLRRLRRLCERVYRSHPTFVVTTATVANPREHACTLLGVDHVEVISEDGSPHGPKCFVLWNPPLLTESKKARSRKAAPQRRQAGAGGGGTGIAVSTGTAGTASRGTAKRVSKRALEEAVRQQVRDISQQRGGGTQLGALSEGDWVAAVKLGRRYAAVEEAVQLPPPQQGQGQQQRRTGSSSLATATSFNVGAHHPMVAAAAAGTAGTAGAQATALPALPEESGCPDHTAGASMASSQGHEDHHRQQQQQQQQQQQRRQQQQQQRQQQQHEEWEGKEQQQGGQHHQQQQEALPALAASIHSRPGQQVSMAGGPVNTAAACPPAGADGAQYAGIGMGPPAKPLPRLALPLPPPGPPRPLIRRKRWGLEAAALLNRALAAATSSGQQAQRGQQAQQRGGGRGRGNEGAALLSTGNNRAQRGQRGQREQVQRAQHGSQLVGSQGWDLSASGGASGVTAELEGKDEDEVQSRLPSTAAWKAQARSGTAGTPQELRRSSPIVELSLLLAECVQHGLRTIAFCHTRKLCELVTAYVREMLRASAPALEGTISVYRAGYSPAERREIERALFQGQLRAVAATNALELGIDVGSLDVTLHLGFPGSVASLWQQAGRAGRREQASMSIYVAWDGPLDQYFMRFPERLFSRPIEKAQLDPRNPGVLEGHLACAAAEAPLLLPADEAFFGDGLGELATGLTAKGLLGRHPDFPADATALHYVGTTPNPAAKISLRAIDPDRFSIVNEAAGGEVIEEIEESKAFYEVYDGAVYMFQGRTYMCKKLDLGSKVAVVRPADLKYYTACIDYTDVHVTGGKVAFPPKSLVDARCDSCACCGEALVTTRWLGFNRVWRGSGQVFDTVDLFLPDVQFSTEAAYIRVPPSARQMVREAGLPFREGLHAASHAVLNVLPLYLMSNANDVGTECDNPYDTRFRPERLLIYDKHPGGIGLAAAACPIFGELLRKALELVEGCDCTSETGCPGCIQHTHCAEYNTVLNKESARLVLGAVLEAELQRRQQEQQQQQQQAQQQPPQPQPQQVQAE